MESQDQMQSVGSQLMNFTVSDGIWLVVGLLCGVGVTYLVQYWRVRKPKPAPTSQTG